MSFVGQQLQKAAVPPLVTSLLEKHMCESKFSDVVGSTLFSSLGGKVPYSKLSANLCFCKKSEVLQACLCGCVSTFSGEMMFGEISFWSALPQPPEEGRKSAAPSPYSAYVKDSSKSNCIDGLRRRLRC